MTQLVAATNLPVVPHGGDTLQIHQPLVAVMPSAPMLEYLPWIRDLFMEPIAIENGHMRVPQTPSASTRVRADSLERWRVA